MLFVGKAFCHPLGYSVLLKNITQKQSVSKSPRQRVQVIRHQSLRVYLLVDMPVCVPNHVPVDMLAYVPINAPAYVTCIVQPTIKPLEIQRSQRRNSVKRRSPSLPHPVTPPSPLDEAFRYTALELCGQRDRRHSQQQ